VLAKNVFALARSNSFFNGWFGLLLTGLRLVVIEDEGFSIRVVESGIQFARVSLMNARYFLLAAVYKHPCL